MIIARWGTPVETVVADAMSSSETPRDKKAYQAEMELSSSPRELTPYEANAVISQAMYQWAVTHPEAEVKYVEVEQSSPQKLRFQFIAHEQSPIAVIAAIATALGALLAWMAAHAVGIMLVVKIAAIAFLLIRVTDYFLAPTVYECPYDGKRFSTYEALVAHIQSEHPGKAIPERPPAGLQDWLKYIAIAGAAVVAIVGISYAYRVAKKK